MDLQSLIPMLESHGVKRFEGYGIKLEFHSKASASGPTAGILSSAPNDAASGAISASIPGPQPTMDLPGTNDAMSEDSILHWSAPPGENSLPLPLTGEEPAKAD